jgi:hypothetical protein
MTSSSVVVASVASVVVVVAMGVLAMRRIRRASATTNVNEIEPTAGVFDNVAPTHYYPTNAVVFNQC